MTTSATGDDYRLLHAATYMALFCLGVYGGSFGPVLPFVSEDLEVSLDTAGLVLTALFLGSIVASALVAIKLHRRDARVLCGAGLAVATIGLVLFGFAPTWETALASAVVIGVGDGLIVACTHILIAKTTADVPSGVNKLNLFFGFGAVAGPLWAGAILETTEDRWLVYAGICVVTLASLALMIFADVRVHHAITDEAEEFELPANATTWIMGFVLFLYVGAEFGLGSWVASYTRETAEAGVFVSAALTAGYWAALALGRVASGMYFARGHNAVTLLAIVCAGGAIASLVLALSSGNLAIAAVSVFFAGFFFGPMWPSVLAIVSHSAMGSATAATVTMGNAGGLILPWAQGRVLVGAGPGQGVAVTSVLCAVMFAVTMAFRARRDQTGELSIERV